MENKSTKLEDAILKKVLERLGTDKKDKPRRSEEYRLATKGIKSGKENCSQPCLVVLAIGSTNLKRRRVKKK